MSPATSMASRSVESFPRVSGDEPHKQGPAPGMVPFSPRERG